MRNSYIWQNTKKWIRKIWQKSSSAWRVWILIYLYFTYSTKFLKAKLYEGWEVQESADYKYLFIKTLKYKRAAQEISSGTASPRESIYSSSLIHILNCCKSLKSPNILIPTVRNIPNSSHPITRVISVRDMLRL